MKKIVIFFLFKITFQACGEGCLQCVSDGDGGTKCGLCDVFNKYKFNAAGDGCEQNTDSTNNCLVPRRNSTENKCLLCKGDFYPGTDGACVAQTNPQDWCLGYTADNVCGICNQGMYVNNGKCVQVTDNKRIQNCLLYSEDGVCQKCEKKYELYNDGKQCVIEKDSNCILKKIVTCKSCKNTHYYVSQNESQQLSSNIFQNYFSLRSIKVDQCKTKPSTHALTLQKCTYFDEEGKCKRCQSSSSSSPRYFANPQNQCAELSTILNSVPTYDTTPLNDCQKFLVVTGEPNVCVLCNDNKILSGGNCTTARQDQDSDCKIQRPTEHLCNECNTNYKLSPDRKVCLKIDEKCKTYVNGSSYQKLCKLCDIDYYWHSGDEICKALDHSGDNCAEYTRNTNICINCKAKFFKDVSNNCIDKSSDVNCLRYKQNKGCIECKSTFKPVSGSCVAITDNCLRYDNSVTPVCLACAQNYYLDTTCQAQQNCAVKGVGRCEKCENLYQLDSNGNCIAVTINANSKCLNNYTNQNSCSTCDTGFYPDNLFYKSGNTCVAITTMSTCLTMKTNRNYCDVCQDGYIKVESGKKCLNLTKDATSTYIFPKDCKKMDSSLNCIECDNNTFQIVDGRCVSKSIDGCRTYQNTSFANECDVCEDNLVKNSSNTQCSRDNVFIENCSDQTDCSNNCENEYYWSGGFCLKQFVSGCSTYTNKTNTCTACYYSDLYYLDSNQCKHRTVFNCATYNSTKDECTTCASTLTLSAAKTCHSPILTCTAYDSSGNCTTCGQNTGNDCGLANCKVQSSGTCTQCNEGYSLFNTECQLVAEANKIANCKLYGTHTVTNQFNDVTCIQCQATYALKTDSPDQGCHQQPNSAIDNCEQFENYTGTNKPKCLVCKSTSYTEPSTGDITACPPYTSLVTVNCKTQDQFLNKCSICNDDSSLSNGECTKKCNIKEGKVTGNTYKCGTCLTLQERLDGTEKICETNASPPQNTQNDQYTYDIIYNCLSTHQLSQDKKSCIEITQGSGCQKSQIFYIGTDQRQKCILCTDPSNIILGPNCYTQAALDTLIPNCKQFGYDYTIPQVICSACEKKYYFETSNTIPANQYKCVLLNKPNCKDYDEGNKLCISCTNGHVHPTNRLCQTNSNDNKFENCLIDYWNAGNTAIECDECLSTHQLTEVTGTKQCTPIDSTVFSNCENSFQNQKDSASHTLTNECYECKTDKLFATSAKEGDCVAKNTNCQVQFFGNTCEACIDTQVLASDKCHAIPSQLDDCLYQSYTYTDPNLITKCEECNPTDLTALYILNNFACTKITYPDTSKYCEKYQVDDRTITTYKCTECIKDYLLVNGVCYQEPDTANVTSFKANAGNNGIVPATCDNQAFYTSGTSVCTVYDATATSNCDFQNLAEDKCLQCNRFAKLDANSKCEAYNLLQDCEEYSSQIRCHKCKAGYYLTVGADANTADTCTEITLASGDQIPGCIDYDSQKKCVKCNNTTHEAINGTCIDFRVTWNCVKFEPRLYIDNRTECRTCRTGFQPDPNNHNICQDLLNIRPSGICSTYCNSINQSSCSTFCGVVDCKPTEQNNDSTCNQCLENYRLTLDKKNCISDTTGCENLLEEQKCMICKDGHQIDSNGICQTQAGVVYKAIMRDTKTMFCLPGYYQNAINGTCTANTTGTDKLEKLKNDDKNLTYTIFNSVLMNTDFKWSQ